VACDVVVVVVTTFDVEVVAGVPSPLAEDDFPAPLAGASVTVGWAHAVSGESPKTANIFKRFRVFMAIYSPHPYARCSSCRPTLFLAPDWSYCLRPRLQVELRPAILHRRSTCELLPPQPHSAANRHSVVDSAVTSSPKVDQREHSLAQQETWGETIDFAEWIRASLRALRVDPPWTATVADVH
jgi:hypothetical protein